MQFGFNTPFAEQLDFLKNKLALPSERWDDIKKSAHDKAFIVAGAGKADLVQDLQKAIIARASDGLGLNAFRKDFESIVQKNGWSGWAGQGSKAGEAWRTKLIYQTNMSTSYAAGRWQQLNDPELLSINPYFKYVHADSVNHPRVEHLAWDGIVLPANHPFWQTHFAPNGWGCQCRIESADEAAYQAALKDGKGEPPKGWDAINPKTGAPIGIDKGFDYAPGARVEESWQDFITEKLIKLDAPIGAAMWEQLAPVLFAERNTAFAAWVDAVFEAGESRNLHRVVGAMSPHEIAYYTEVTGLSPVTAEIAVEDRLLVGKKATRHQTQGNALSVEEWKSIPTSLEKERRVYFDKVKKNLLYVFPSLDDRKIKLAVEVNFVTERPKKTMNLAQAGFKINDNALLDRRRYDPIE